MKSWEAASIVIILFILYMLTSCVSVRKYRIDQELAYHNGRQSAIWKISDWLHDDVLNAEQITNLVDGMKSGEYIWSDYFVGKYFPQQQKPEPSEWDLPPHTFKDPFKPLQGKERAP